MQIVTFVNVSARYGDKKILSEIDLSINEGDFVVLTGSNGGGKTTLIRLIAGLMSPCSGIISRRPNTIIGYQPQYQHIDKQFPLTIEELVLSGVQNRLHSLRRFNEKHHQQAAEALKKVDLQEESRSLVSELSGGQLQRALFARAIVSRPDLLILDEPDTYLDASHKTRLYQLLEEYSQHCAIVMVSHDAYVREHLAKSCIEVESPDIRLL